MLRRLGVRGKVLATLAVPVLVLSLAAVFLSGSAVSDAQLADSNRQIVDSLYAQDVMTRAMQRERAAAFAYGGQAEDSQVAYRFARIDTDRAMFALDVRLNKIDLRPVDDRVADAVRVAKVARSPERLDSVRSLLSANVMTSTKTVQALYDDIIDAQMAVSETASNRMDDVRLTELLNGYNALDQTMNQFSITTSLARWILQSDLTEKAIADARYELAVEVSSGDLLLNDAAQIVDALDVPGAQTPAVSAWSPLMRAALGGATPADLALAEEFSWAELGTKEVEQIRPARDQMRDAAVERAGSIRSEALRQAIITISIAVLAVLASVAVALLVARRITEPLRRLTMAANDVRVALPDLVEQVAVPGQGPELEFARIPIEDDDEVGQLASAFNDVNETTLEIAREQALLRGSIAEMFVNVARRDQALLSKQLAFLDELERSEEDPNTLANLFRLDHFATRMRRNAESLLVLAGIESGRRVRDPMPLSDVIRTASSEIEQYDRIQLEIQTDPSILGHHALITAHLLAELLENATEFSQPGSPVMVREAEDDDWVTIEIVDTGLGMSTEDIDEANRKVTVYAGGEIVGAERLGLYVVGRLAHRLGASVRFANLDPGAGAGVRVRVQLPKVLFLVEGHRALPEPTDPLSADTRAATEAWMAPDVDVARVSTEMDAFRDQESPIVTAIDLDSLTDGRTASGMPRRRSRAVDLSAPAPSEAFTAVVRESNLDVVSPQDGTVGTPEVEWNPTTAPSADDLPSRTATAVRTDLVPEPELLSAVPVPRRASLFSNFRTTKDLDSPGDEPAHALDAADSALPIISEDTTPTEAQPTRASVRRARERAESARTANSTRTEQDTMSAVSRLAAEPALEPAPLFDEPFDQNGLIAPGPVAPGPVAADVHQSHEGASPSQGQFSTESHFVATLSQDESVADGAETAFASQLLPTSRQATPTFSPVNPSTEFEPFTAHDQLPDYAEVVGSPTVRELKAPRRGRLGRKRRPASSRRDKSARTDHMPAVPQSALVPAIAPMFEPEPTTPMWHQAVSEPNVDRGSGEGQHFPKEEPEETGSHPTEWAQTATPFDQVAEPSEPADFFSGSRAVSSDLDSAHRIDAPEHSYVLPEPDFAFTPEPDGERWIPPVEEENTFDGSAVRQSQWSSDDGDHSSVAARLALRGGIQEQALAELSLMSAYRPSQVDSGATSGLTKRVRSDVPDSTEDVGSQKISRDAAELRARLSAFVSASSRGREEGALDAHDFETSG